MAQKWSTTALRKYSNKGDIGKKNSKASAIISSNVCDTQYEIR